MKFLLGFGIGLGLALLFAPASGEETRRQLADRVRVVARQKTERAAEAARQKAGEVGSRIGREAAEAAVEKLTDDVLGREKGA